MQKYEVKKLNILLQISGHHPSGKIKTKDKNWKVLNNQFHATQNSQETILEVKVLNFNVKNIY